mmetsp:Transcript_17384/g.28560  ORF Transcript_17384/g.28560 Transcript_17384/m.28560 type:complete len:368 (-) Transcript_17384:102-1205(-)
MDTTPLEQHRGPLSKSKMRQTSTNQCCGSTSTIIKVVLAISTFVVLFTVPLLHRMVALDSQMPSARDQELNHQFVTVKDDTGGILAAAAAPEDEQRPKRKGEETKTNREATDEVAWEIIPATDATRARLKPATLCTCAKCGSTSMWEELFAIVQGRSFKSMNYTGPPWIHKLSNKKLWTNIHAEKKTDWSNFKNQDSFALIRDPKERIVSAWKSKVTCDGNQEISEHKHIVPKLLELAGSSNITAQTGKGWPCLDLSDYLAVLSHIHAQGQEGSLEEHFLPQHLGCFKNAPPSLWTVVTTVSDPTARCSLKSVVTKSANMSNTHDDCQMVKGHGRKIESINITREDEVMLETITRKEYGLLGQYLNV